MAETCVFCEEPLGFFSKEEIVIAGVGQPCCKACFEKIQPLPLEERERRVLATGRARGEKAMREWIGKREEEARRKEEQRQALFSGKTCLRCGGKLFQYGKHVFKLGEETFFFSDINRLMSGSLEMEILRCEDCGKAEFYIPDEVVR